LWQFQGLTEFPEKKDWAEDSRRLKKGVANDKSRLLLGNLLSSDAT
jgi:hypothetical protein